MKEAVTSLAPTLGTAAPFAPAAMTYTAVECVDCQKLHRTDAKTFIEVRGNFKECPAILCVDCIGAVDNWDTGA